MEYLPNISFAIVLVAGIAFFRRNVLRLIRNIKLGKEPQLEQDNAQRWKNMALIALGQSKMVTSWPWFLSAVPRYNKPQSGVT